LSPPIGHIGQAIAVSSCSRNHRRHPALPPPTSSQSTGKPVIVTGHF
jgi:hypothetical protein